MKLFVGALAVAMLAGCSTSAVTPENSKPVPADKVFGYQTASAAPNGTLTITRDSGFIGFACDMGIYIDGKLVAKIGTKERVQLYLPVGSFVVGAGGVGAGLCENPRREREVSIGAGQAKRYRVFTSSEGDVDILPSTI